MIADKTNVEELQKKLLDIARASIPNMWRIAKGEDKRATLKDRHDALVCLITLALYDAEARVLMKKRITKRSKRINA